MFVGPIVLIILKNIFSNFLDGGIIKTIFDLDWFWRTKSGSGTEAISGSPNVL